MTIKPTHVIGAALAGVAVGGAAVALSDQKNRKKLQDTYTKLNKKGAQKVQELQSKAQDMGNRVMEMTRTGKEELKEKTKTVNKARKKVAS